MPESNFLSRINRVLDEEGGVGEVLRMRSWSQFTSIVPVASFSFTIPSGRASTVP